LAGGTTPEFTYTPPAPTRWLLRSALLRRPAFLKTLPNGLQVLAVDPPGVDVINVNTTPVGCSPPVSNTVQSFNLGQGSFVPVQLILSQDGTGPTSCPATWAAFWFLTWATKTSSAIPLAGDAIPLQGSLTADGNRLYIVAADGQVQCSTPRRSDVKQIFIPHGHHELTGGLCLERRLPCNPDLIAVET